MKKTAIIAAMLLLGAARAGAQGDSCLEPAQRTARYNGWGNADSAMVDTCKNSPTFDTLYGKRFWSVGFNYAVIHPDTLPSDSVVVGGWQAIDTMYPQTRAAFKWMDSVYGGVTLRFDLMTLDTNFLASRFFALSIGDYEPVDSIVDILMSIPYVGSAAFFGTPVAPALTENNPDSCLELAQQVLTKERPDLLDSVILNPDSTKIDTCQMSLTFDTMFSVRSWYVQFEYAAIQLSAVNADSNLEVNWRYIQPSFSATRAAFGHIDSVYGGLLLRKVYPGNGDSTSADYNTFEVILNLYQPYDSVLNNLEAIPLITKTWWAGQPTIQHQNASVENSPITGTGLRVVSEDGNHYQVDGLSEQEDYAIYDLCGRIVRSGSVNSGDLLNTRGLLIGPYFLRIGRQIIGPFCFQN